MVGMLVVEDSRISSRTFAMGIILVCSATGGSTRNWRTDTDIDIDIDIDIDPDIAIADIDLRSW